MCCASDSLSCSTAFTLTIIPAKKTASVRAKFSFEAGAEDELGFLVRIYFTRCMHDCGV